MKMERNRIRKRLMGRIYNRKISPTLKEMNEEIKKMLSSKD